MRLEKLKDVAAGAARWAVTLQPICPFYSFSDYETPTNIHLKHSIQHINSNSHSFETHASHYVEKGPTAVWWVVPPGHLQRSL